MTIDLQQEIAAIRKFGAHNIYGDHIAYGCNDNDMVRMQIRDGLLECSIDTYSLNSKRVEFNVDEWEAGFIRLLAAPSKAAAYSLYQTARLTVARRGFVLPRVMPHVIEIIRG